jgi:hypothetical protein
MAGTTNTKKGSLLHRLKEQRANVDHLLVHVDGEDEPRRIPVPDVRRRWERVMAVVGELQWTKVEAQDKKGGLLFLHRRGPADEEPAMDLEDIGNGIAPNSLAGVLAQVLKVSVGCVVQAQESALSNHREATQQANDMVARMVESTHRRIDQFELRYEDAMDLNRQLQSRQFAEAESQLADLRRQIDEGGGEDGEAGKALAENWPLLFQAIFAAKAKDDGKLPAKPTGKPAPAAAKGGQ